MSPILLQMNDVRKAFFGVPALRGVDLTLSRGEVLSIVGMNGAGKSTLSHIVAGVHSPDSGEVLVAGRPVVIRSPKDAERLGIGMVSQEPTLCENLTVAQNIFLNKELVDGGLLLSKSRMRKECRRVLDLLGYSVDPDALVEDLPLVARGVVSIARAMLLKPSVLILDEVTAPLNAAEVKKLFSVIGELKASGIGVIFISHKLQEVIDISDRIMVVRDGLVVGEFSAGGDQRVSEREVIHLMLGEVEDWKSEYSNRGDRVRSHKVLLETDKLSKRGVYDGVSVRLHGGEVLGLAGLKGAGISEFLLSLFGAIGPDSGVIHKGGQPIAPRSPEQAKHLGIGMVTNDRQKEGLALMLSVEENVVISSLEKVSRFGFVNLSSTSRWARHFIEATGLKATGPSQPVRYLSGGNQQKVAVAKWLLQDCEVIIVDEPTRGVDVKAKSQIYDLLAAQRSAGKGVLVHSPEVRELLTICDRILIMSDGRIVSEVLRGNDDFNESQLLAAIHGAENIPIGENGIDE
jgi:ABC-type sugar transport system ATPase subunit